MGGQFLNLVPQDPGQDQEFKSHLFPFVISVVEDVLRLGFLIIWSK